MRISDLKIDGFGVWSGLELVDLSDQLNVFYGPNEAGKTTLMQFVRSMLYGFSADRRARYLPPLRPGRPGGTIRLAADQASYALSRHADEGGDAVVVTDDHQKVHDEPSLAALLGHVDEPTFNNVFACGLREIQELGTLGDTQAADELYSLALGLDRVSLVDVLGELETSRNRLLAPDDRPSLITQLLGQRQRLQDEIDELAQSTPRYLSLGSQQQKLAEEIHRLEAEAARLEREGRELSVARALTERWQRRQAIDSQLQLLSNFSTIPDGALATFDRLQTRIALRRRRIQRLKGERKRLRGEIERLQINEPLCRNALRIEALGEQQQWIESLEGQVAALENEVLQLEAQRDAGRAKLGLPPHAATDQAEGLSKRALSELRDAAKALSGARRAARELPEQSSSSPGNATQLSQKLDAALGPSKDKGLTQSLAEAGELVSQLRKRVQLDERLDQMSRRQAELDEQNHEHLEKQMLPAWVLASLGCLFVLGCALVLLYVAGLALPASLSGSLGWPVGLVGALAAGAAAAVKFGMERGAARNLDTCQEQAQVLGQQTKQATAERDALDEKLPRGGGPLVVRLQTAEKAMAALEQLLPLQSERETAERQAASAQQQADSLRDRSRQMHKNWRRLLATHGLPAELRPNQLREYSSHHEQVWGLTQRLADKTDELNRRRAEYGALAARIAQIVDDVRLAPRSERPLDRLRQCLTELKEQQARVHRREELQRQIARQRRRQATLSQVADKLRRHRQALLQAAATNDEQEFRRRAQAHADASRLTAERSHLAQEISAALAGQFSEEQLAERLSGQQNLEQIETQLTESRRAVTAQLNEALVRRGEMNQQLKSLLDDRQLAHKQIELDVLEKRLQDAIDRWRVLAVCGMMLEAVRVYYEREHQPQALREASVYLERLTGGRYTRVWTPLGEHALKVDDQAGNCLAVEVLSRGTREQLFLALRLALVSSYTRRGVDLPLVLDDVLVNFDVGRAKAAAAVLRDFAKAGHQLLVFTCHEHIAKLFKHIKAEVRQLPDNSQPRAAAAEPPAIKRARRHRPETPAEPQPELAPDLDELGLDAPSVVAPTALARPMAPLPAAPPVVFNLPPTPPVREPVPDAPEPAPAAAVVPPPPPVPTPAPRPRPASRPPTRRLERVRWSAEEFDGELSDRVRRPSPGDDADSEPRASTGDAPADDDAEAA